VLKHEVKLIDPDAERIVAALSETTAGANKRCRARLLNDDPAKWRKVARAVAAKSEGYEMFRGGKGGVPATQVLAAWWTDAAGRKHVVCRGRRIEDDEARRLLHKEELDRREPLWHAYPEYVCRRTVGNEARIVCACGCGAVGTPESLGWMGETCGPCADRKEEVGPVGLRGNLPGVLYGDRGPLGAVACSPDGNRVVAVEGHNSVTSWYVPIRTGTPWKFSGAEVRDVALTSDGRHMVAVGMNVLAPGGLFAAFDLTTDPPTGGPVLVDAPVWRIVALPDPGLAFLHRWGENNSGSRGEVIRIPSGKVVRGFDLPTESVGRLAVSRDGTRCVTPGSPAQVYDLTAMRRVREVRGMHSSVAFSHDGARVFTAHIGTVSAHDSGTGGRKPLAEGWLVGSKRGGSHLTATDFITTLAVDPSGAAVFAGTGQGRVFVFDPNTLARRAVFEWHLGTVAGLALSADGSRLFSAGGDGCVKVWPIRDLLRGV
jgi:hypothetical protein